MHLRSMIFPAKLLVSRIVAPTSVVDSSHQLGRRQAVKAPGFDPGIRRFESSRPSHFINPKPRPKPGLNPLNLPTAHPANARA